MNKVIELYIEGQLIDLDENVSFPITKQINDIFDPGSIKTDYSKTISIPNTGTNNSIFGHIWSINKEVLSNTNPNVGIDFNPSKKANYRLLYNGLLFQSGYLKLTNIRVTNRTTWRYEINLFSQLGTFITALGDDLLTDSLTDSAWDQTFRINATSIKNLYLTIQGSNKSRHLTSAATLYAASDTIAEDLDPTTYYNDKFFDIIDSENGLYGTPNLMHTYDNEKFNLNKDMTETFVKNKLSYKQRFGVYTDMILKNFATEYGYTIDWSSIESSSNPYWYNTMVTSPILSKAEDINTGDVTAISGSLSGTIAEAATEGFPQYSSITFISNPYTFTLGTGLYENTIYKPASLITDYFSFSFYDLTLELLLTGLPTGVGQRVWVSNEFYAEEPAGFDITITAYVGISFEIPLKLRSNTEASATDDKLVVEWRAIQSVGFTIGSVEVYNRDKSIWVSLTDYLRYYVYNRNGIFDSNSATFVVAIEKIYNQLSFVISDSVYGNDLQYDEFGISYDSNMKFKFYPINEVITNSAIKIRQLLPAIKTKDFFLSYIKMFGLYVEINELTQVIKIKNRNDFYIDYSDYENRYKILDWNDKLVRDRDINIVPLNFDKAFLRLGYKKKAESQLQKLYFDKHNEYYGDAIINTGYDFNKDTFDLIPDIVFEPIISADLIQTILGYEDSSKFKTIPINAKESSGKLTSYDPVGLVFMNKNKTIPEGYQNLDSDGIHFNIVDPSDVIIASNNLYHNKENQTIITYNEGFTLQFKYQGSIPSTVIRATSLSTDFFYKQSGNRYPTTDDSLPCTHSLDFYKPNEIYTSTSDAHYPDSSTIYNRYWKNYIEDRYNVNTKIVTAYFYLTPLDVVNFRFKDFVQFDGNLYSVNKIIDYDITTNIPTKVELVKVNNIDNYINGVTVL